MSQFIDLEFQSVIPLRLFLSSFFTAHTQTHTHPNRNTIHLNRMRSKQNHNRRNEREKEKNSFAHYAQCAAYEIFDWINSIDLIKLHGKNSNAV